VTLRRSFFIVVVLSATAVGWAGGPPEEEFDRYGGWTRVVTRAAGWFRTEQLGGRWWLVDPEGHVFLSLGVNTVSLRRDTIGSTNRSPYAEAATAKYGSPRTWARAVVARLRSWGFNTLGAGSDTTTMREGMAYTVSLNFSKQSKVREGVTFPDVFDPAYRRAAMGLARRVCGARADDPWLIGYFTDEELRWGPDLRSPETLFAEFLRLGDRAPGRRAAMRFLEERYRRIEELNEAWRTEYASFREVGRAPQPGSQIPSGDAEGFLLVAAQRYFSIAQEAIRSADQEHLILGCRFAGCPPAQVLEAMRPHVDVVSINHYGERPPTDGLRQMEKATGLPVVITEFGFRARDSGLPNSKGEGPVVDTQEERARLFERYVREVIELPMVVGYHWFQHVDQPREGRFDGEDSNHGLVDVQDEPYETLVDAVSRVNRSVWMLACGATPDSYAHRR
jgi:hypothetical protein